MINLTNELAQALVQRALEARENAYCPYSGFAVGAALLCGDGTVYSGCNIECASLSPGNCAERTAFFRAVNDGQRSFAAIAVAGGPKGQAPDSFCAPCGVCRQVMREFCQPDFAVIMTDGAQRRVMTLEELLPMAFGPDNLK
ncbi:MAG: cytidine deaminase [Acutalibacter sp.]|nr:cytidine deaminase [Acutalibacter sp.]